MLNLYKRILFPWLKRVDAEKAHDRALAWLGQAQELALGRLVLRLIAGPLPDRPVDLLGLTFPNVLGVAAGFDKDARVATGLALLGFGHVEVGTLTPRPQAGNPKPRIFRLPDDGALINRLGFPNGGVEAALPRLHALSRSDRRFVLGVSLGKQKETPLEEAATDYGTVMRAVYPYADYLAVNVSSPNTPGLRLLQEVACLRQLLIALRSGAEELAIKLQTKRRPLLVKIAPDLSWPELDDILLAVTEIGIDGIIATNTTLNRSGLTDRHKDEQGGLSGPPLRQRSNEIIAYIRKYAGDQLPVIGVGGVSSVEDVRGKLAAGASLVQMYTGLVFEGPRLSGRILRQLVA
jgi:dihydroorotate dehydrogenase